MADPARKEREGCMDNRNANLVRKRFTCLRCARLFWTDRCHRICARCHRLRRGHGIWDLLADLYRIEMEEDEAHKKQTAARQPKRKMG